MKGPTRILVVDDFAPFRSLVGSLLSNRSDWTIVAEAADGQEAVEKAKTLRPEVILLDIAMPQMNGMQAAEQILAALPTCKIIFLSQEASTELIEEAMRLNASGHVSKAKAARDLVTAIEAAMAGRKFFTPEANGQRDQQDPKKGPES